MNKKFFAQALLAAVSALSALPTAAQAAADTQVSQTLPGVTAVAPLPAVLPHRGQSMQAISKQYGEPRIRHAAAGGDTPLHPPITRWDYDGFSVYFEHTHVITTVVPSQPTPLHNESELQRSS